LPREQSGLLGTSTLLDGRWLNGRVVYARIGALSAGSDRAVAASGASAAAWRWT